jgi:hypothetical protein
LRGLIEKKGKTDESKPETLWAIFSAVAAEHANTGGDTGAAGIAWETVCDNRGEPNRRTDIFLGGQFHIHVTAVRSPMGSEGENYLLRLP